MGSDLEVKEALVQEYPNADDEQINTVIKYLLEGYFIQEYDDSHNMFHMNMVDLDIAVLRGGIAVTMGAGNGSTD